MLLKRRKLCTGRGWPSHLKALPSTPDGLPRLDPERRLCASHRVVPNHNTHTGRTSSRDRAATMACPTSGCVWARKRNRGTGGRGSLYDGGKARAPESPAACVTEKREVEEGEEENETRSQIGELIDIIEIRTTETPDAVMWIFRRLPEILIIRPAAPTPILE